MSVSLYDTNIHDVDNIRVNVMAISRGFVNYFNRRVEELGAKGKFPLQHLDWTANAPPKLND